MLRSLILILVTVAAWVTPAQAETLIGRVVGVSDGDTLTVLIENGGAKTPMKVRLAEIDAPESKQPWGSRAKQALSALVYNKTVRVDAQTTDRYGRKVAEIYVGDEWVNARMVRDGHAWVYRQYSRNRELLRLEDEARTSKRGLWSLPESQRTPPWAWRRGSSSGAVSSTKDARDSSSAAPLASAGIQCGSKRTCAQMASCEEAKFYLNRCGLRNLDRDGDGLPCESLCR